MSYIKVYIIRNSYFMDNTVNIEELKKLRARLFAKRSTLKRKGQDTPEIDAQLEEIKQKLSGVPRQTKRGKVEAKPKVSKPIVSKPLPEAPVDQVKYWIKRYGWKNGMNFSKYGLESMVVEKIKVKDVPDKEEVLMTFTLHYKTKRHESKNDVVWHVPYAKIHLFKNDLHNVQYGIKVQKIFSDKKFVVEKFNNSTLPSKGWKLIK